MRIEPDNTGPLERHKRDASKGCYPAVGGGPLDQLQAIRCRFNHVLRQIARLNYTHPVVQLQSTSRFRPVVLAMWNHFQRGFECQASCAQLVCPRHRGGLEQTNPFQLFFTLKTPQVSSSVATV